MGASAEAGQRATLSDYLAAERTLVAWIRTALALMGFGFVVARFGLFLQQLQIVQYASSVHSYGLSLWFGSLMQELPELSKVCANWSDPPILRQLCWAIVGEAMVVETQGMGMVFWRLKDGPMCRVFRIVLYGFLFLLVLSVAGREIPEISNLADDPSNDGQVAIAHNDALPSPNLRRLDATDASAPFGNSQSSFETQNQGPRNRGSWCHPFVALAITGQDRLRFLAVRRT